MKVLAVVELLTEGVGAFGGVAVPVVRVNGGRLVEVKRKVVNVI